jgi:uncharacterized protein (UPF0261 family)
MCNFWAPETIPSQYRDRKFYHWNPNVTLMRTTPEENAQLGAIFAEKLNAARGPAAVYIPWGGWSEIDLPDKPFYWPEAMQAFVTALKAKLRPDIPVVEMQQDINDPAFATATVDALLKMVRG